MNYKDIDRVFSRLQSVGFAHRQRAENDSRVWFDSVDHTVAVGFLDLYATIQCDIYLKAQPELVIDAYSAIVYFNRATLVRFFQENLAPSTEVLANFICDELVGRSSQVFAVRDSKGWRQLVDVHARSMKCRNRAFWMRASGHADGVLGSVASGPVAF